MQEYKQFEFWLVGLRKRAHILLKGLLFRSSLHYECCTCVGVRRTTVFLTIKSFSSFHHF